MPSLDAEIRSRCSVVADELVELVKRSAVEAVRDALGAPPARSSSRPRRRTPAADAPAQPALAAPTGHPLSLEHYQRMAILRALAKAGGKVLTAARLMGESKSTLYRHVRALGIPRAVPEPSSYLVIDGPPTLAAYEKAALERAMAAAGGHPARAVKLLGVGNSTVYRKVRRYGVVQSD